MVRWKRKPGRAAGRAVILNDVKDPAVPASGPPAARITGAGIARTVRRRVLRFAQDDRDSGDSIKR
jgi:hypothetical protein